MSTVVTGATGPLGRLIVTELLRGGVPASEIVAGGRQLERLAGLTEQGVRAAALDYTDRETLDAAFAGADTVMLVSGSEVGQRVEQHRAVIEAAQAAGVERIVYTSAPAADTSPLVINPEHKATEELLHASGLTVTVLRNNWYTENYLPALEQARVTGEVVASAGDGRVASAPRADYAAAAAVVLQSRDHDGRTYELAGDQPWTFHELATALSVVLDRPVAYRPVSTEEHLEILRPVVGEGTAQFLVAMDANIRDGLLAGGSTDLSGLLGRPTTPLVDALRDAAVDAGSATR